MYKISQGIPPTLTTYVNEPMTVHVKVTDNSNKVTDAKLNGNSSFVQSNDREYQKNNRSKREVLRIHIRLHLQELQPPRERIILE